MIHSKGIALILAFFPFFGLIGLDKYYTGNYIIGMFHTLLAFTFIGTPLVLIWNILTVISLLILIFLKYNLLLYVKFENETSIFDYVVGIIILMYLIFRYKYIYEKVYNNSFINKSTL